MNRREFCVAAVGGGTSAVAICGSWYASQAVASALPFNRATLATPSWTPAPGEFQTLVSANSFMSLAEGSLPSLQHRFGTIVDDFSGGVSNPFWGALGAMVFHGGGHAATYDNSVLILDYNDLTFKRLSSPSPPSTFTRKQEDPFFSREACEYGDGQPGAAHTYDTLAILPPADGGAAGGSLIRVSSHAVHPVISCNTGWAHRFDMTPAMSRGQWSRWSLNGPVQYRSPGACSAYDPKRKRFWWIANLSRSPPLIRYLDVDSREQREVRFKRGAQPAPAAQPDSMTMRYDPVRDLLVLSTTVGGKLTLAYINCPSPEAGWRAASLTSEIPSRSGASHPFDHVAETDRFVMLAPADPGAVYEITIPATSALNWSVTRRPFANAEKIPVAYVSGKRWSYAPSVRSFVWLARSKGPLVAYRPVGT